MENKKTTILITFIVIAFCIIMAVIDGVLMADYFTKSMIKLILFLGLPLIYGVIDKNLNLKRLFIPDKNGMKFALILGGLIFIVIVGSYILLKDIFDFSKITLALTNNIGVNKNNFIYVSLYISFVNSLLEEFFFRGFAFLTLSKVSRKFAYIFSAMAFSLYHVAMMVGWFSIWVFLIVLAGLFIGGLIFNYLNEKSGTIYPSWFVHMFANFSINTIGFILFGIL